MSDIEQLTMDANDKISDLRCAIYSAFRIGGSREMGEACEKLLYLRDFVFEVLKQYKSDTESLQESLNKQVDLNSELSATIEMQHTQIVLLEEAIR